MPEGYLEVELFMRVGDGPIRPTGKALIPIPAAGDTPPAEPEERWGWQDGADPPKGDPR